MRRITAWARKTRLSPNAGSRSWATWTASARSTGSSRTAAAAINLLTKGSRRALREAAAADARAPLQGHRRDRALRAQAAPSDRQRLPRRLVEPACATASTTCSATSPTWQGLGREARLPARHPRQPVAPTSHGALRGADDADLAGPALRVPRLTTTTAWPTANCDGGGRAGARGVHTSVNGMGERAGNTQRSPRPSPRFTT